jgi:acyl-CoA thioesterase FadM
LHVEADYLIPLWFRDEVDFDLRVDRVGRSSLRYRFEVRKGSNVAARGLLVVAYLPPSAERPQPWPNHLRRSLSEGGAS